MTAQDELNRSMSPLGHFISDKKVDGSIGSRGRFSKLFMLEPTSEYEIEEFEKERTESLGSSLGIPPSILLGMPIRYVPFSNDDSEEEEPELIFDEDEESLPEVMQSDWIHVTSIKEEDLGADQEMTVYEAKRLRLNAKEIEYLKTTCGIEEAERTKIQCDKLWIVRSSKNDSDQRILLDKELKAEFRSVVVNGNAERTGRDVKVDNQLFWINAAGFISLDPDLKLDGVENLFF